MATTALVTGGSGYFGSLLVAHLHERGSRVRVLDLNDSPDRPAEVEFVRGDIRDDTVVRRACHGANVVYHTAAQVPLARNRRLLHSVNVDGTHTVLKACAAAGVSKVIHLSSSAVLGIPKTNPVRPDTLPAPVEPYGRSKYQAEMLCQQAVRQGLDVTVIRPRTLLGAGRLGIFSVLFDFIADGADVFVLAGGQNTYQFLHVDDLVSACLGAARHPGPALYNVGAPCFGTMRQALENLCVHAATGSGVRSLPAAPATWAMHFTATLHLAPFSPYHWAMYGHSMWFDIAAAQHDLGWRPRYSNDVMLAETYDHYLHQRLSETEGEASHHRSPVSHGALRLLKMLTQRASNRSR
ncbi:NAD-dependent epimerase/dehydratase family protein [Streptomyces chartreusis]|uniref:NAD-dependent epimerase/dehydratase family protein n=1 Tax=Streptomyces chartreusis TaxID=1969 RepID=UPI00382A718F